MSVDHTVPAADTDVPQPAETAEDAVEITRLTSWALAPVKKRIARSSARQEAAVLAESFRYHRLFRHASACPPWVLGQELGWVILSPVTITLTPLDDIQLAAHEHDGGAVDPREAARLLGREDFWRRGDGFIATRRTDWLRSYQFRGADGAWEGMFLPNGQGTVEWRLGWGLRIPDNAFLMITALDDGPDLTVPTGILTARQANRTSSGSGFSIAIRPTRPVTLERGEPVARIILLDRRSLQATLVEQPERPGGEVL